jgi:hypothetical protein
MTFFEPRSSIRPEPSRRAAGGAVARALLSTLMLGAACMGKVVGPAGSPGSGGNGPAAGTGGGTTPATGSGGATGSGSTTGAGSGGSGSTGSGSAPGSGGSMPSGTGGSGPVVVDCGQPTPGPAPIRRLTRFEYSNTVRDLLGDNTEPGDLLPPELKGNGFSNDATSLTTTRLLVDAYQSVAHDIAARATKDAAALSATTKCDTTKMTEDACAQAFVTDFGARAARRPLDTTENQAVLGVYKTIRTGGTYADGIAAVIEMMLQSPQFLYRPEFGVAVSGKPVARITGYEMATRLSYLLWSSTPDKTLLDAAKNGQLETKEQVLAQATRMLDDPHAKDVSHFFHNTLLGINGIDGLQRDATAFPVYKPELATLFRLETEQFLDHLIWKGQGDLGSVFTAQYTFLNATLSKYYGIGNVTGDTFQMVATDGKQRGGVLTQASVLAITTPGAHNNPVVRGKFIYQKFLCGVVPDPPPALMVQEPPFDPTRTTRERFEVHRTDPNCIACHQALDPIGYGLENYNGIGLWQDTDAGKPIDASGSIPATKDAAGPFVGAIELGKKLAASQDAQNCYVGNWLTFAYGRVESSEDACNRSSLQSVFKAEKGNIKKLMLALTQTDAFLYRPVAQQ